MSLLETVVALALTSALLATSSHTLASVGRLAGAAVKHYEALSATRNMLEAELGARCAAAYICPAHLECDLERVALAAAQPLERVTARVSRLEETPEEYAPLSLIIPGNGSCP